ncbi:MAG: PaaI family thioesterase [Pararhodobacter sp.]|nr:PaaI family thioesterase [Pararhodobacter sp.]
MPDPHIARHPDEMARPEQIAAMSGIDYLRAMVRGDVAGPPMAGAMGFLLHDVAEGRAVFRGTPAFEHLNPMSVVHGGWYGTLLDSAMGCAVASVLPAGRGYTTLEYKVNLIRALPIGTLVECTGRLLHAGRSTAVADGEIRGVADGRLYASGSTTCIIFGG